MLKIDADVAHCGAIFLNKAVFAYPASLGDRLGVIDRSQCCTCDKKVRVPPASKKMTGAAVVGSQMPYFNPAIYFSSVQFYLRGGAKQGIQIT